MVQLVFNFVLTLLIIKISIVYSADDCPVPSGGPDQFRKTGPHSKYVYNPKASKMDFVSAKALCASMGLEMAEVRSIEDLRHLANFTKEEGLIGRNWGLGVNDEINEGEFLEDNGTPIQFHAFWANEPLDRNGETDCVVVSFVDEFLSSFAMFGSSCSAKVYPLCQWEQSHPCNLNSISSIMAEGESEENLRFIGDTPLRRYYASSAQKTWSEALTYCARNRKLLADFADNDAEVVSLSRFAQIFSSDHGLHDYFGFWTSGKYEGVVSEGNFNWQSTGVEFSKQRNISSRSWRFMSNEPYDPSSTGVESCVSYFAPSHDGHTPFLSASSCSLPYYFFCYDERDTVVTEQNENSVFTDGIFDTIAVACEIIPPGKLSFRHFKGKGSCKGIIQKELNDENVQQISDCQHELLYGIRQ